MTQKNNPEIIEEHCSGCRLCARACPFGAISIREKKAVIDYDKCTVCGACATVCKTPGAIRYEDEGASHVETGKGDVWVLCEHVQDQPAGVTGELLGKARSLAERLGVEVCAVMLGENLAGLPQSLIELGADTVFVADDPALADYRDEPYARILASLIDEHEPEILLGGATAVGRALLPRVAVLVHTGLTADCTSLEIDPQTGLLQQTRPAFGGNIMATITCESCRPQMATVRPGVLPQPVAEASRRGVVRKVNIEPDDLRSALTYLKTVASDRDGEDIREAEIVVAAGRGAGGPQGVELVSELADTLGASLGASRSAVDAGWVSYSHQVGQTGTTVQPELYIACGISGAVQHLVGMQNSGKIIAINRDPEAPIFDHADIAVVGDLQEILPSLIKRLRKNESLQG